MTTKRTYRTLSEQEIKAAVFMIHEKRKLKEIASRFNVKMGTLYSALRRYGFTVASIKAKSMEEVLTSTQSIKRIPALVTEKQKLKPQPADSRLVKILEMLEKNPNLEETSHELGISRQRVCQILKGYGFSIHDFKQTSLKSQEESEKLLERELKLKRQAFRAGLTMAKYLRLLAFIGSKRMSQLSLVERGIQNNTRNLKIVPSEKMCQMTALELFELYVCVAKKIYPDLSTLAGFDRIMESRCEYRIVRTDRNLPFTTGNIELITLEEFGHRFARQYGILSPKNPLHQKYFN